MKKLIAFILVFILILAFFVMTLSSCNMGIGLGKFTFNGVHLTTYKGESACLKVEKWYDDEEGIEIKTENYGTIFASEGTYILFEDTCPICGSSPKK